MPSAEIVAVGTEVLLGDIADTNSQALGRAFAEFGIVHQRRTTVGDNLERCANAIAEALARCDLVVTIGGLGPTPDDLTREALANASGAELVLDEEAKRTLRDYLQRRKREWSDSFGKQAMKPKGARLLRNDTGTAPGILYEFEYDGQKKTIIAMPGPKAEFEEMLHGEVGTYLQSISDATIRSRTLKIIGIPEASVAEIVSDILKSENPTIAPYAKQGEIHLRITANAQSRERAEQMIKPVEEIIRARFGKAVYGADEEDLAAQVLDLISEKRRSLVTAESCTGGLLGTRLTSIPGSSGCYIGGFVTYTNEMKARFLGVARSDLSKFGAVSEPVARQMAEGASRVTGADYGVGITGIAGPGGDTETKPVGLVFVSVSGPDGTEVSENHFRGGREHIRFLSTQRALEMLRNRLL